MLFEIEFVVLIAHERHLKIGSCMPFMLSSSAKAVIQYSEVPGNGIEKPQRTRYPARGV
jgi:hypothetical protein